MKTQILYISNSFKNANLFLKEIEKELNENGVPILDFCGQGLFLETDYCKLRCIHMNSHHLLGTRFKDFDYFVKEFGVIETEFEEMIAFRLKPDVKEIVDRQWLIKLLAGM